MSGVEAKPEDVVVLDVEHAGHDLEQDAADKGQQRDPFNRLREERAGGS